MRQYDRKDVVLEDDGTPRRKYEFDEPEEGKAAHRIAIGLVLANSFLLIKNVLFGNEPAYAGPLPGAGPAASAKGQPGISDELLDADAGRGREQEQAGGDEPPEDPEDGGFDSGTSFGLFTASYEFEPPAPLAPRRSGSSGAGNDNEALYMAAPGRAIGMAAEQLTSPGGSGASSGSDGEEGGGRSSGGDPGDDDDGDPDGDPDDDGDDDDGEPSTPRANRLPSVSGAVVLTAALANQSVTIAEAALLQNAVDPDGDVLRVLNLQASSGTVTARSGGGWIFTPERDDVSDVTFRYIISDGKGLILQRATMDLLPVSRDSIVGTAGSDLLIGTPEDDVIDGLGGDDDIIGREGDDVIHGGAGNDRIVAGEGDDVIFAGDGNDVVFAGAGNDRVFAGAGDDIVYGEDGDDVILAEAGDDIVLAGAGDDVADGGAGNDTLKGEDGDDTLIGADGDDLIDGGDGNDKVSAGAGEDTISGGLGNDVLFGEGGDDDISGGDGNDTMSGGDGDDRVAGEAGDDVVHASAGDDAYDGGTGSDTYSLSGTDADAIIDLERGTASSLAIGEDTLVHFEVVVGGNGNDTIIASSTVETMSGGEGLDIFVFGSSQAAGLGAGGRDRILDFAVGDRIDLDDISDEFETAFDETFTDHGIRKFVIISQHSDFSRPGEMRFKYDEGQDQTVLEGNIDHDADTEFELEFSGNYQFTDNDFHWRG
jgi:Ca2+-binding RTX toxin-like protein